MYDRLRHTDDVVYGPHRSWFILRVPDIALRYGPRSLKAVIAKGENHKIRPEGAWRYKSTKIVPMKPVRQMGQEECIYYGAWGPEPFLKDPQQ